MKSQVSEDLQALILNQFREWQWTWQVVRELLIEPRSVTYLASIVLPGTYYLGGSHCTRAMRRVASMIRNIRARLEEKNLGTVYYDEKTKLYRLVIN